MKISKLKRIRRETTQELCLQFRLKQGKCANILDFNIQKNGKLSPLKHNANCLIFIRQGYVKGITLSGVIAILMNATRNQK